jgi:hypothetical protein
VLVIVGSEGSLEQASAAIRSSIKDQRMPELLVCRFLADGASQYLEAHRD